MKTINGAELLKNIEYYKNKKMTLARWHNKDGPIDKTYIGHYNDTKMSNGLFLIWNDEISKGDFVIFNDKDIFILFDTLPKNFLDKSYGGNV